MANLERINKASFWHSKNIFVTGGGGFVGSWLVKALVEAEANVICLIRDQVSPSNLDFLKIKNRLNLVQGSATNYSTVERVLNEYEIDTCFHLAAQATVGVANRSPLSTFESNIRGTWTILETCRHSKSIKRIVVASSDKAYGDQNELPYRESFPLKGLYPYDASKVCTDVLTRSYYHAYRLPLAVTRCANIYGGGDLNFSRLIPGTILFVLENKNPIIRSDGTPVRDYIYIDDVVQGYLVLAERLDDKRVRGEAFNFGTNSPISVIELVEKIIHLSGNIQLNPKVMLKRKIEKEIDQQYLSSLKAEQLLQWRSKIDLDRGLELTYSWYQKNHKFIRDSTL